MASAADAFRSSTTRAVGLRRRGDLVVNRQVYQGQAWWVVKDPISLQYFRFRPEEYALLDMLDGSRSLDVLKEEFEARFPPRRITVEELSRFIATLHRSGLVIGDRAGQGPQLFERRRQRIWKQWMAWLSNIMSMRFRGIDPDWMLERLDPWFGWLFSPPAIMAAMVFVASALLLVLVNFDVFRSKLPEFHQFFAAGNWLYLGIALGVTKVLHEFGHGLSCKHYGGECHEMGVMLLVFTPCLYCDVSDSWMLPNKWKRAAIGAAGMYVEVIIASIATYLWWNSHAGVFNQLCLDVMFVSSVSTILFNANPLLRYDGYYILSDVLEIPNLRQKANTILQRLASRWCLGIKQPEDPFLPQRNLGLFALYAVASSVYGWIVTASIFLFVWNVFKPYRLEVLGQIMAFGALWGLVIRPLQGMIKFLKVPGRRDEVKARNVMVTAAVATALLAAIALIPLPQRVWCPSELRPRGEETVYVPLPGTLEQLAVKPGAIVKRGEMLARLSSIELDLEAADLEGRIAQSEARLVSLGRERFLNPVAGQEIATVKESIKGFREQLAEKVRDRMGLLVQRDEASGRFDLRLVAPRDGVVLPATSVKPQKDPGGRLPAWSGNALDEQNVGAMFPQGTVLCMVGDPERFEAVMVVDQSEMEFVGPGQRVDLKLDAFPWKTFSGTIDVIAETHIEGGSERLSVKAGGQVPTETDEAGREMPISTSYEALMTLDDTEAVFTPGMRGTARIKVGSRTVGQWLLRLLWQTFNFRM
ncbi:MAG: HlyD family efflux transporter periplasmic adaptor subunit [Planctomycetota bacterium]|nr:MAG: HlyD family efflux transporter periplasmic adaptor subunit [Planctomycetota bacterium]